MPTPVGIIADSYKPPGGGGGFTDPTSLPNLLAWYDSSDASTFSYSSGVVVSQWRDKSTAARHMTNTLTGPDRTGTQKGLTIVYIDGKPMKYTGSNLITGTTMTVCIAMKMDVDSQGTGRQFSCGATGTTDWSHVSGFADNIENGNQLYPSGYRGGSQLCSNGPPALALTWFVKTWVFNGSTSALWVNTTAKTPVASTGTFDVDEWSVGQAHNGGDIGYQWLGEIAIYSDAKSGTALSDLQGYMIGRWV